MGCCSTAGQVEQHLPTRKPLKIGGYYLSVVVYDMRCAAASDEDVSGTFKGFDLLGNHEQQLVGRCLAQHHHP